MHLGSENLSAHQYSRKLYNCHVFNFLLLPYTAVKSDWRASSVQGIYNRCVLRFLLLLCTAMKSNCRVFRFFKFHAQLPCMRARRMVMGIGEAGGWGGRKPQGGATFTEGGVRVYPFGNHGLTGLTGLDPLILLFQLLSVSFTYSYNQLQDI